MTDKTLKELFLRIAEQGSSGSAIVANTGMAAICLVAALAVSSFWYGKPIVMMAADCRTAPGEQQSVTLPDGSVVEGEEGTLTALGAQFVVDRLDKAKTRQNDHRLIFSCRRCVRCVDGTGVLLALPPLIAA